MFENVLIISVSLALIIFQITSIISLNSDLKKYNSLSEKKDEKFRSFCETLKDERESLLVDKKSSELNIMEYKCSNTINK